MAIWVLTVYAGNYFEIYFYLFDCSAPGDDVRVQQVYETYTYPECNVTIYHSETIHGRAVDENPAFQTCPCRLRPRRGDFILNCS